ncbi:hypothetical protein [Luteolibacter sp. LG18]|uniref:hypothetical protein n=1 Tax=Luteolibacter sp. LG18 TaxID=2819286 RepID=UPI0030C73B70
MSHQFYKPLAIISTLCLVVIATCCLFFVGRHFAEASQPQEAAEPVDGPVVTRSVEEELPGEAARMDAETRKRISPQLDEADSLSLRPENAPEHQPDPTGLRGPL